MENDLQLILKEMLDVITQIEKRTVEKPSDNYTNTPIKKQIMSIKHQINKLK